MIEMSVERCRQFHDQGIPIPISFNLAPETLAHPLLARIPFSELKIDRSFVDGASKKHALGTVLRSCLGLAHSLERMSVAVGVETRQDWDFLQGLGCTYAQGYHIANPMEASAFPGWLEDWRHFF